MAKPEQLVLPFNTAVTDLGGGRFEVRVLGPVKQRPKSPGTMSTAAAALRLNLSEAQVRRLCADESLASYQPTKKRWLVLEAAVEIWRRRQTRAISETAAAREMDAVWDRLRSQP